MCVQYLISLAGSADAADVFTLYRECARTPGSTWNDEYPALENINDDIAANSLYIMRDCAGHMLGAAFAGPDNGDMPPMDWRIVLKKPCALARIGIAPAQQRRGLAHALLDYVLSDAVRRGFDGVRLLVAVDNAAAQALYARCGFMDCGSAREWGHEYRCLELRL